MGSADLRARLTRLGRLSCDAALSFSAFVLVIALPAVITGVSFADQFFVVHAVLYAACATIALIYFRTYRTIWRYVGFRDLLNLLAASVLTVAAYATIEAYLLPKGVQHLAGLMAWTVMVLLSANIGLLVLPRLVARAIFENSPRRKDTKRDAAETLTPILVTGEIARIEAFIRENGRVPSPLYRILGILTDDNKLFGSYLQGVQVLGSVSELTAILPHVQRYRGADPTTLVLAKDDATRQDFERLIEIGTRAGLKSARLAPVGSLQQGDSVVQPIELADLLGRPEVVADASAVKAMVRGKRIFVTGAGGSIGSELCRQIAALQPEKLIVADMGEFNLYSIDKELDERFPSVKRQAALMDVRDSELVRHWIEREQPDIVFHAAALKHVPLLEDHPTEAVRTNVLGTINVADACVEHHVAMMVTISTDKAVNPCNVMGATKRLAEAYCQGLDQLNHAEDRTRFVTVRFGNVLGSAGSVVPLFRRQIEAGGPVTVTHPDVVRYFMTIPEAVTLVLEAGANGIDVEEERGSIYVLEMGKPVKIIDLARQMIRLSGYRPDIDIDISIVGLRPGEKLYEEVAYGDEKVEPTRSKSIVKLTPRATDHRIIRQQVQELRQASISLDSARTIRLLEISVPEFRRDDERQAS